MAPPCSSFRPRQNELTSACIIATVRDSRLIKEPGSARPFGVLVADDCPYVLDVAAAFVEILGGVCVRAINAWAAVEAMELHGADIDVAIIDLLMPGADAYEARRLLHGHRPGLPCCLMSGTIFPGDDPPGGFDTILAKPFSLADMRNCLEKLGVMMAV